MADEPRRAVARHALLWVRYFFSFHLLYSGLRFTVFHEIPPLGPIVQPLIDQLQAFGIYQTTKYLETVVGCMLLFDINVPLALILEMPATITIVLVTTGAAWRTPVLGPRAFLGAQELLLNGTLLACYSAHYRGLLNIGATRGWLDTRIGLYGRRVVWLTLMVVGGAVIAVLGVFSMGFRAPLIAYFWMPPVAAIALTYAMMLRGTGNLPRLPRWARRVESSDNEVPRE